MLVGLAALMSLAMIPASAVTNLTGEYTFTTNTDPYAILALNNNTASASFGIQANSVAPAAAGIYGYSNATGAPGYGVEGISQNGYGILGSSYGTGVTAILGQDLSTGSGIGIAGQSAGGNGAYGEGAQNGIVGQSNAASGTYAGVLGEDNSGSGSGGFAYGVEGTAVGGDTAIGGFAGGSGDGLVAGSTTGDGVFAISALFAGGGIGELALPTGEGADIFGYSGNASHPALVVNGGSSTSGTDNLGVYNSGGETFIIQAQSADAAPNGNFSNATDVQIAGDVYISGALYTDCHDSGFPAVASGCADDETYVAKSANGAKIRTYSPEQSTRTIEDLGEAQLVNGQGHVALEPTFASTIARDRSYLVFITPEGDSRGLYVTGKTLEGFTVRESSSGHSTLAFQYRIVAHPFGDSGARMAAVVSRRGLPTNYHVPTTTGRALKAMAAAKFRRASLGARITREPHIMVQNLHRQ
jgi:hypothetical protein